jgi:hypothetical protein
MLKENITSQPSEQRAVICFDTKDCSKHVKQLVSALHGANADGYHLCFVQVRPAYPADAANTVDSTDA